MCKGNLYGFNRPWLTALEKGKQTGKCPYSRNILTRLQLDLGKLSNVVLNNFHFCTKEKMVGHGNASSQFLILIYPQQSVVDKFVSDKKTKVDSLFFHEVLLSESCIEMRTTGTHCQIADFFF